MSIELKIKDRTDVKFPIIIENTEGNKIYEQDLYGNWYEWTYDNNNKCLTYKDSKGLWYEYTYDENNNILTYKDSFDCYEIKGQRVTKEEFESFVIPEYTMEELVAKLGYSFKIKK